MIRKVLENWYAVPEEIINVVVEEGYRKEVGLREAIDFNYGISGPSKPVEELVRLVFKKYDISLSKSYIREYICYDPLYTLEEIENHLNEHIER